MIVYPARDIRPFVMYCVNGKPRSSLHIIESVDSISRDERGFPLTQYITNGGISRAGYTITHFKNDHRVLRLISNRMNVLIAQFRCAPREVKNRHFGFFFFFSSGPTAIVSYLLTLVYM